MIKFDKPTNLNGAELLDQLAAVGVIVNAETSPLIDANGDFWLDILESDKKKAEPVVAAHNGTLIAPNLSVQRRAILDRLGITAEEAALLLS
jgi:hypothetical protein